MKVNFEFNWTQLAIPLLAAAVIVVALLATNIGTSSYDAGQIAGFAAGKLEQVFSDNPGHLSISEADFNKLTNLVWVGGTCERMGLTPNMMWQTDEQGNRYAIPICVNS